MTEKGAIKELIEHLETYEKHGSFDNCKALELARFLDSNVSEVHITNKNGEISIARWTRDGIPIIDPKWVTINHAFFTEQITDKQVGKGLLEAIVKVFES